MAEDKAKKRTFDPAKKAVALQYDPKEAAPHVVAKGQGYVAGKLLEKAALSHIPIHRDPALAEALTQIDLGDFIPPELYEVVAQILIFIGDLDRKAGINRDNRSSRTDI